MYDFSVCICKLACFTVKWLKSASATMAIFPHMQGHSNQQVYSYATVRLFWLSACSIVQYWHLIKPFIYINFYYVVLCIYTIHCYFLLNKKKKSILWVDQLYFNGKYWFAEWVWWTNYICKLKVVFFFSLRGTSIRKVTFSILSLVPQLLWEDVWRWWWPPLARLPWGPTR